MTVKELRDKLILLVVEGQGDEKIYIPKSQDAKLIVMNTITPTRVYDADFATHRPSADVVVVIE